MSSGGEASGKHVNLIEIEWEFSLQEILLVNTLECNQGEALWAPSSS
jgi:hypothetical protein